MNLIKSIVIGVMLFSTIAYGAVRGSLPEFANVKFEHGVLIITTDDSQGQFVGKIGNNGIAAVLTARSEIKVPLNETSLFYLRHFSLTFTPLAEGKGFVIKKTTDLRSLRRGMKEESFSINIDPNGSLIFGEISLKEEPSGEAGKIPIERHANMLEKSTDEEQATPAALDNLIGKETAAQAQSETKTTAEVAIREADSQRNLKPLWIIGFSGLVALILLLWVIKKRKATGCRLPVADNMSALRK